VKLGARGGRLKIRALLQTIHSGDRAAAGRSGAQPLAAARTARVQHLAAALGRHARAEPVTALAYKLTRLIGPFHGYLRSLTMLIAAI
jgi:hypothetical protein